MALPIPLKNPLIEIDADEDAFNDIDAPEDEAQLATGAWDDEPDDNETDGEGSSND